MRRRLAAGTPLGRYELLAPVAQGGMAEVWAARLKGSRGFQKLVAIKTILPHLSDDARFERMFLDEAALASRIRHPHVVEIMDLGEQGELLYLVMEWIEGETFATLMRKAAAPVPPAIASRLVMQACAGLHAAHELRDDDGKLLDLVHRDVSPQNILVTRAGAVKIVDFGIAKALGRLAGETAVGSVKGKVPYMAPEQARGEQLDRRVDVFALGVVYYFLVTGKHPFRGDDEASTVRNVVEATPPRPREIHAEVPEEIERVILEALAREPGDRFPTMAAFELAIATAMTRLGLTANDESVKAYVVATLGDRAAERRAWLADAIREVDRLAQPGATPTTPVTPTPRTDAATVVTAPTKEDTNPAVGSEVHPVAPPPRRATARLAAAGMALVIGGVTGGVWLTRAGAPSPQLAPPSAPAAASVDAPAPSTTASAAETVADAPELPVAPTPTEAPSASAAARVSGARVVHPPPKPTAVSSAPPTRIVDPPPPPASTPSPSSSWMKF